MSDLDGASTEIAAPEGAPEGAQPDTGEQSGGNPSWDSLRQSLDPVAFKLVEPHLKQFDQAANTRITDLNKQLDAVKWANGMDASRAQLAMQVADTLEHNPEKIFSSLVDWYRQQNLPLPGIEQQEQQLQEPSAEGEPDEVTALRQQVEQMQTFLQSQQTAQEEAQLAQQAQDQVAQEFTQVKADPRFARFGDADWQMVANLAALQAQQATNDSELPELSKVAEGILAYQNQILGTPRPGASAPRLVPTSGGTPSSASEGRSLGQLKSNEVQGLVSKILEAGNS